MRLIAALFLFAVSLSAGATNYYRWGFEDTRASWGIDGRSTASTGCYLNPGTGCTNGTPAGSSSARDCTVSHTGSCSMKLVVIGNDGGNQGLGHDGKVPRPVYGTFVGSSGLYYRFWMRIDTGWSWGSDPAGRKVKSSRVNTTGPSSRGYTGYLAYNGVRYAECETNPGCLTNTGATNTDSNLDIAHTFATDSQWHEYIVFIKPNTVASCTAGTDCDAIMRLWVDNVLIGSNVNWKAANNASYTYVEQWGGWMVYPYFQLRGTASDGGTMYIDDVSIDDAYNSMIALPKPGSGSVSDISQFLHYSVASYRHLGQYEGVI